MIIIPDYSNKAAMVYGLGKSGKATVRTLVKSGAKVYAWDDNEEARAACQKEVPEVVMQEPEKVQWLEIKELVLSPGVPFTHPAPHKVVALAKGIGCNITCDIELLHRAVPQSTFVGITGTNGKSTTTALTGHICYMVGLGTAIGGNIGTPALQLPKLDKDGVYVLEMSSYQLDLLNKTRFNIAALLNITPDHIDRHGSLEGYIAAKSRIFNHQMPTDVAIIAVDDPYTKAQYDALSKGSKAKVIAVSAAKQLSQGISVIDGKIYHRVFGREEVYDLPPVRSLPGKHNAQNIAVAYAIMVSLGVRSESIIAAIKTFPGLKHRIEFVDELDGVRFINDSKATNAVAAEKAISSFHNIYWIAGGIAKEGGITSLQPVFSRIKRAYLIGQAQDEFAATLEGRVEYRKCTELVTAVQEAYNDAKLDARNAPVVLLSPACASFDQFKNFEARGNAFCKLVSALNPSEASAVNAQA